MSTETATGDTGTKDKAYDIIWFTEKCLDNVLRLETYIQDAERDGDDELAAFFRKAQTGRVAIRHGARAARSLRGPAAVQSAAAILTLDRRLAALARRLSIEGVPVGR